jgi:type II restriction enzyme
LHRDFLRAEILYLGDTAKKDLYYDEEILQELNIPITQHSKLPDVIIYDRIKNWLFLIEAVTSHGPVTPERVIEIEEFLKDCNAGRVYVSAFPDFAEFKKHTSSIAWETEVWLVEVPDHMIHFNGDRFLGPR